MKIDGFSGPGGPPGKWGYGSDERLTGKKK